MVKALLLVLALTGCASAPNVRIADVPEPPVIARPDLPVLNITATMDAGQVLSLHRQTIKILQAYAAELEAALNAYRKK